jgi:hypothetical protein
MEFQFHILGRTNALLRDGNEDVGKKLLSELVNKFSLRVDNEMSRILVNWVAKDKLKKNEIDSLSSEGLKYLLMNTFNTENHFATPEFEIWEYALMKAKRSLAATTTYDQQRVREYLTPLIGYMNLNRVDPKEFKQHIEPLGVFSIEEARNFYCSHAMDKGLEFIRGAPIFKWKKQLGFTVSEGGFVVEAVSNLDKPKSILGDLIFKGKGVYKWSILIEKLNKTVYIGIFDVNENLNTTDQKYRGWVLGSDGYVYYNKNEWKWYDARFKVGDKVTVHLDMKMKTCAFSINENKKPIVSQWKNIPSQVYPIVSLGRGSKLRIDQNFYLLDFLELNAIDLSDT